MTNTEAYLIARFQDQSLSWANRIAIANELVQGHGYESTASGDRMTIERAGFVIAVTTRNPHGRQCCHCGLPECDGAIGPNEYANHDFDRCQAWHIAQGN